MPYDKNSELPDNVSNSLPSHAQETLKDKSITCTEKF